MRRVTASLVAAALLLAACGEDDGAFQAEEATPSRSASPSASASAATPTGDVFALAVEICTEGVAVPDSLVSDASHAARNGTRSVSEIADTFREAQDAVEDLAAEAEAGDYPRLTQALQTYADTLGRARVSGTAGLTEILDAREAIDLACYTPTAPES